MQGQRAKKPRVGPWHQNKFQACIHWNEQNMNHHELHEEHHAGIWSLKIGCDSEYSDLCHNCNVITMLRIIFPKSEKLNRSSIACYVIIQRPVGTPRHLFSIFIREDLRLLQGSNITKVKPGYAKSLEIRRIISSKTLSLVICFMLYLKISIFMLTWPTAARNFKSAGAKSQSNQAWVAWVVCTHGNVGRSILGPAAPIVTRTKYRYVKITWRFLHSSCTNHLKTQSAREPWQRHWWDFESTQFSASGLLHLQLYIWTLS